MGTPAVDPTSFQRSAGLSGGGTVSWQLTPSAFGGVAESPGADAALAAAAVALAGALRGPSVPVARGHGTSGALMLADGGTTADTSLREPLGRHPLATAVLSEVVGGFTRAGRPAGIGQCVEVTLVSALLYDLGQRWTAAGRPGDLRSYALEAFRGAVLAVRQIGDVNGRRHGEPRPPCRACALFLERFGIRPALPPEEPPAEPERLVVPTPADMSAVPSAVSTGHREWLLGARFGYCGRGPAGLMAVGERLRAAGPGATALVLATWTTVNRGPYTWTAANRDGTVVWLDNPSHEVSESGPLYASTVDSVWTVVLDAGGRPLPAEGPPPAPVPPLPPETGTPFDPAEPTAYELARLAEVRFLADAYTGAGPDARVALRAEISALVDALGVRPGDGVAWAALPSDVAAALLVLVTPVLPPGAVATVLAADPARLNPPQRAWQADYREHLSEAFDATPTGRRAYGSGVSSAVAADLADRAYRLAVRGESEPASVPRLPAYAGQVIGLPPDRVAVLRGQDPDLADLAAAAGVYIDLTGRPDLTPYVAPGVDPVPVDGPDADLAADRVAARAALRAAAPDPAVPTVLSTHEFHYVGPARDDGTRLMALVPDLIVAAVRAITPVLPPPLDAPELPEPLDEPVVDVPPQRVRATATLPNAVPAASLSDRRRSMNVGPAPENRSASSTVYGTRTPDPPVDIAYYALADNADRPTGLLVVAMLPTGPQTLRWETPGARTAGSPSPVGRERAEEISRQVLGFELPAEPRLPELLNGR